MADLLLQGITFATGLDCLQCCQQSTCISLSAALAGCWAPHFVLRQCGGCDGRQLQLGPDRQLLGCRLLRWLGMAADQLMRW
jgi:hypothetical protein